MAECPECRDPRGPDDCCAQAFARLKTQLAQADAVIAYELSTGADYGQPHNERQLIHDAIRRHRERVEKASSTDRKE